jgi:hypothetical protein
MVTRRIIRASKAFFSSSSTGTGNFYTGLIDSHMQAGHSAAQDDDAIGARPELWAAHRAKVPRVYLAFGFTPVVDRETNDKACSEGTPLHSTFYSCGRLGPTSVVAVAEWVFSFQIYPSVAAPDFVVGAPLVLATAWLVRGSLLHRADFAMLR